MAWTRFVKEHTGRMHARPISNILTLLKSRPYLASRHETVIKKYSFNCIWCDAGRIRSSKTTQHHTESTKWSVTLYRYHLLSTNTTSPKYMQNRVVLLLLSLFVTIFLDGEDLWWLFRIVFLLLFVFLFWFFDIMFRHLYYMRTFRCLLVCL